MFLRSKKRVAPKSQQDVKTKRVKCTSDADICITNVLGSSLPSVLIEIVLGYAKSMCIIGDPHGPDLQIDQLDGFPEINAETERSLEGPLIVFFNKTPTEDVKYHAWMFNWAIPNGLQSCVANWDFNIVWEADRTSTEVDFVCMSGGQLALFNPALDEAAIVDVTRKDYWTVPADDGLVDFIKTKDLEIFRQDTRIVVYGKCHETKQYIEHEYASSSFLDESILFTYDPYDCLFRCYDLQSPDPPRLFNVKCVWEAIKCPVYVHGFVVGHGEIYVLVSIVKGMNGVGKGVKIWVVYAIDKENERNYRWWPVQRYASVIALDGDKLAVSSDTRIQVFV